MDSEAAAHDAGDSRELPAGSADTNQTAQTAEGSQVSRSQGRKPKACLECKKLKIRCDIFPGDRKCRHCLRRKLDCFFNKTYIAEVQDPTPQNGSIMGELRALRAEFRRMQSSLDTLLTRSTPQADTMISHNAANGEDAPYISPANGTQTSPAPLSSVNIQTAMTRDNSAEPETNRDFNMPVSLEEPMESLYEVTRLRNIRINKAHSKPSPGNRAELNDFISRGVISEAEALELYDIFVDTLNHFLWVGIEQIHTSLTSIRQSSELLTATILCVTLLHIPATEATFNVCYKEFLSLVSGSMFSRDHSLDDVRALCIAAFWLSEVSWTLSGHAIRIATELDVHRAFARALNGDRECFLRARLWYILYVCDHHYSIAYGRPPMLSESVQIRQHELFLASSFATVLDARLVSQVNLMQILARVYYQFAEIRLPGLDFVRSAGDNRGSLDSDREMTAQAARDSELSAAMLSEADLQSLRSYNLEIDEWRTKWYPRQPPNSFIGDFPRRGVMLYSFFAKLQISSFAVRGISKKSGRISSERRVLVNQAVSAAVSILTLLEEDDMRRALVGTPLYVHTMIAFASVFLMKSATILDRLIGLNIDYSAVVRLLRRIVVLLRSSVTSERHMTKHLARGLEKMLNRLPPVQQGDMSNNGSSLAFPGDQTHAAVPSLLLRSATTSIYRLPQDMAVSIPTDESGPMGVDRVEDSSSVDVVPQGAQGASENGFLDSLNFPQSDRSVMEDMFMYDAFGLDSTNDVYNLLATHFHF